MRNYLSSFGDDRRHNSSATRIRTKSSSDDECTIAASNKHDVNPSHQSHESTYKWKTWFQNYFRRNRNSTVFDDKQNCNEVESHTSKDMRNRKPSKKKGQDTFLDYDLVSVKSIPKTPATQSPSSVSSNKSPKATDDIQDDYDLVSVKSIPKRPTSSLSTSNNPHTSKESKNHFQDYYNSDFDLVSVKSMPKLQTKSSLHSSQASKNNRSRSISASHPISSNIDLISVKSMPKTRAKPSTTQSIQTSSSVTTNTIRSSRTRSRKKTSYAQQDIDIDALNSSLGIGIVSVTSSVTR